MHGVAVASARRSGQHNVRDAARLDREIDDILIRLVLDVVNGARINRVKFAHLGALNLTVDIQLDGQDASDHEKPVTDFDLADIDALLAVNVRGPILATQAAIPHLKAGGRIITIGSAGADRIVGAA